MPLTACSALTSKRLNELFLNTHIPTCFGRWKVSVEGLESVDRERYLDLAVFPEDQLIPEEALRALCLQPAK